VPRGTVSMASVCVSQSLALTTQMASLAVGEEGTARLTAQHVAVNVRTAGSFPVVRCGRGDMRTTKGKRRRGSYGNCRPRSNKGVARTGLALTPTPPRPAKKEDTEFIQVDIDESLFTRR